MTNPSILRTVLATVVGMLLAFGLIHLFQLGGDQIAPTVYDPQTDEMMVPLGATIALFLGWIAGTFAGAWVARRISDSGWAPWFVGGAVAGSAVYRALDVGDAWWVAVAGVILPLGAVWVVSGRQLPQN